MPLLTLKVFGAWGPTSCSCVCLIPNCLWTIGIPRHYLFSFSLLNSLLTSLVSIWTLGEQRGLFEVGQRNLGKPESSHREIHRSLLGVRGGRSLWDLPPPLLSARAPRPQWGGPSSRPENEFKTGRVQPFQWTFLITGGAERSGDLVIWKLLPSEKRMM